MLSSSFFVVVVVLDMITFSFLWFVISDNKPQIEKEILVVAYIRFHDCIYMWVNNVTNHKKLFLKNYHVKK